MDNLVIKWKGSDGKQSIKYRKKGSILWKTYNYIENLGYNSYTATIVIEPSVIYEIIIFDDKGTESHPYNTIKEFIVISGVNLVFKEAIKAEKDINDFPLSTPYIKIGVPNDGKNVIYPKILVDNIFTIKNENANEMLLNLEVSGKFVDVSKLSNVGNISINNNIITIELPEKESLDFSIRSDVGEKISCRLIGSEIEAISNGEVDKTVILCDESDIKFIKFNNIYLYKDSPNKFENSNFIKEIDGLHTYYDVDNVVIETLNNLYINNYDIINTKSGE